MVMVYCRGCARQLHETAPTCPQCGAPQLAARRHTAGADTSWKAIASLILGILNVLVLLDDAELGSDTLTGLGLLSSVGLLLGLFGIGANQKNTGNGMAIAGIVMAVITLLCLEGLSSR